MHLCPSKKTHGHTFEILVGILLKTQPWIFFFFPGAMVGGIGSQILIPIDPKLSAGAPFSPLEVSHSKPGAPAERRIAWGHPCLTLHLADGTVDIVSLHSTQLSVLVKPRRKSDTPFSAKCATFPKNCLLGTTFLKLWFVWKKAYVKGRRTYFSHISCSWEVTAASGMQQLNKFRKQLNTIMTLF